MKKSVIIYINIFFWIILFVSPFVPRVSLRYLSTKEFGTILWHVSFLRPVFFYVGYLLIMKIKWRRTSLLYTIIGIVIPFLILFVISKKACAFALIPLCSVFLWVTIGSLFRIFVDWFKKKNEMLILEKQNLKSELDLLRTQLNPHFLFNTLHNIDALIYEDHSKASKSIEKLSDIMRYMLNNTKSDFVGLEKELEYLDNYISLERIRLKNNKFLNYEVKNKANNLEIAPMLIMPFIENAFKHSVDSDIEDGINIHINIENNILYFVCENHFNQQETDKDKTHGIGLETVKKRLDLIYKNKHQLTINSENSVFKVNLEIELNEN